MMHNKSVLRNSFFLIFTFMIVEAVFGFVSNSLALISDAFHMLSDAAALFCRWLLLRSQKKGQIYKRPLATKGSRSSPLS
ncbi:cation transporter [Campylobacter concisus]